MSKEALIQSADQLIAPDAATSRSLKEMAEGMAQDLTKSMSKRKDLEELIGTGNLSVMEVNHLNHFNYMSSLAALYDATSFVETVIWVFRTYMSRGFTPKYWQEMLPEANNIIAKYLPMEQHLQIEGIYTWLQEHVSDFVQVSGDTVSFYERLGPLQGVKDEDGQ